MPNTYTRKSIQLRGNWTEDNLKKAIHAVKNEELSVRRAAITFDIPRKTLERRIKNNNDTKGKLGPDSLFGGENEKRIVKHIKMQARGFPLTRDDIRHIAFLFAEQLKLKHKYNSEKETAGYVWLSSFLRRNPDIVIRKSENLSLARAQGLNRATVKGYFDLLNKILEENDLFNMPSNIYNMDETSFQLNNRPSEVLATKGSKVVATVSSAEKGETITVVTCCNAEGTFLPPTCIMKGKNKKQELEDSMPPGATLYMNTKSAYINSEIFFKWLKEVFVPRKPKNKVLLILDGHSSHSTSIETLEYAESNGIIMVCYPGHTTHYLQPLDRAVFKSLKINFYESCRLWVKNHPGRRITRYHFGELLCQSWGKSTSSDNAIAGFRATGIYPFNPAAIPEYAFTVTDQITPGNDKENMPAQRNIEGNQDVIPNSTENQQSVPGYHDKTKPSTSKSRSYVSPTSEGTVIDQAMFNYHQSQPSTSSSKSPLPEPENVVDEYTPSKILNEITPLPSIKIETVKKRSKLIATVLTSEHIESCKAKAEKQKEKISKDKRKFGQKKNPKEQRKIKQNKKRDQIEKKKACKRKRSPSIQSSSVTTVSDMVNDLSSDDQLEEERCIICDEFGKNNELWYRCLMCGCWAHELCTSSNSADNFICDYCS